MSEKTGRNELCPCGSGKKYKFCCERVTVETKSKPGGGVLILAVMGVIGIAAAISALTKEERSTPAVNTVALGGQLPTTPLNVTWTPQPPGEAPPGKVWSPEHGHWHNAPTGGGSVSVNGGGNSRSGGALTPTVQPKYTPKPQPSGPVPEGKVWSEDHGHWHDAP